MKLFATSVLIASTAMIAIPAISAEEQPFVPFDEFGSLVREMQQDEADRVMLVRSVDADDLTSLPAHQCDDPRVEMVEDRLSNMRDMLMMAEREAELSGYREAILELQERENAIRETLRSKDAEMRQILVAMQRERTKLQVKLIELEQNHIVSGRVSQQEPTSILTHVDTDFDLDTQVALALEIAAEAIEAAQERAEQAQKINGK